MVVFLVVKYIHKQTLRSLTTSRAKIDWSRFWFAFLIWGVTTACFILLNITPHQKITPLILSYPISDFSINFSCFIPLQTSFEEYLFRGYLMQGLEF